MRLQTLCIAALLVMVTGLVAAQSDGGIELNPAHPESYTVVEGDTLWDISGKFLKEPWYWPEIWYVNPQVKNPHLIFPGDVLKLVYINGEPRIQLIRGGQSGGQNRLSPRIREEKLDQAITTISFQDIKPFLAGGMIMDKDEIDELPTIIALRDHMVAGAGHEFYVRELPEDAAIGAEYLVLRVDDKLEDPDTGKALGYEILYVGTSELRAKGDPNTLFLTKTNREVREGDRVREADLSLPINFFPSAPPVDVEGTIISVVDGVALIGQYQMVILNRGADDGLEAGSVLSVWQAGKEVREYGRSFGKTLLPENYAGHLMVIKAYEDISYALVMEAELEMRVGDKIRNP
jgi:hypothetical protein